MGTDRTYLLEQQYATAQNLVARIALHERFSTSSEPFPRWVFDRLRIPARADVLERAHSEQWSRSFALENGAAQIQRFFRDVEVELFPDSLEVTEIEPLLDFVRSPWQTQGLD